MFKYKILEYTKTFSLLLPKHYYVASYINSDFTFLIIAHREIFNLQNASSHFVNIYTVTKVHACMHVYNAWRMHSVILASISIHANITRRSFIVYNEVNEFSNSYLTNFHFSHVATAKLIHLKFVKMLLAISIILFMTTLDFR